MQVVSEDSIKRPGYLLRFTIVSDLYSALSPGQGVTFLGLHPYRISSTLVVPSDTVLSNHAVFYL